MIAFAHIPKTAGTTLTAILRRNLGLRHFDTRGVTGKGLMYADELRAVRRLYPRLASIAGHGVSPTGDLHCESDLRYYTFVREPIARCLSHFQHVVWCRAKTRKPTPDTLAFFHEWLQANRNWHTRQLAGVEDAAQAIDVIQEKVSFVGVVEQFDESLVMFRAWAGMPSFDLRYRSLNVSAGRAARDQFLVRKELARDAKLASALKEANQEDLELYRWVMDEQYSRQRTLFESVVGQELDAFRRANAQANIRLQDSLSAKAYRNVIFKPLRRFVLPQRAS